MNEPYTSSKVKSDSSWASAHPVHEVLPHAANSEHRDNLLDLKLATAARSAASRAFQLAGTAHVLLRAVELEERVEHTQGTELGS